MRLGHDGYSQIYRMAGKASVGQHREMHLCITRQRSPGRRKRIEEARKGLIGIVHVHDRQRALGSGISKDMHGGY